MPTRNLNEALQKTLAVLLGLDADGKIGQMPVPVIPTTVIASHYLIPQPVGTIIDPAVNALSQTTQAGAANRCDWVPLVPGHDLTIDQIIIEVTTAVAASLILLGIYGDIDGQPGAKLAESAALSGATAATVAHTLTTPMTLQAGVTYWLAVLTSSTATLRALAVGGMYSLGLIAGGSSHANIRRATLGSFVLPETAPATTLTSATTPQFRMRIA